MSRLLGLGAEEMGRAGMRCWWAARGEWLDGPSAGKKVGVSWARGVGPGRWDGPRLGPGRGLGCWAEFAYYISIPLSFLFLIQTKFEFKYKFEFKPHSIN